ncbi:hypothetical protein F383_37471 [Gossypium arboreum]|uniref:Uncharacterized protein n=1 Tax=Gossypium arboreum TaxID=29729 RepID=A0A0B0MHN5_GOSAR|nr:hypothetical protein F383_37471 [Gossypium arboreum]
MKDHRHFYASISNADHGVNPAAPLCSLSCNGDGAKTSNGSILPGLRDALFLQVTSSSPLYLQGYRNSSSVCSATV